MVSGLTGSWSTVGRGRGHPAPGGTGTWDGPAPGWGPAARPVALLVPQAKSPVFIPIPKKGNAKECSNCHTIALISHASKVTLKILQARFHSA